MISEIYQKFYNKLPCTLDKVLPEYNECKLVTCLNPFYLVKLKNEDYHLYDEFNYIASDGMGPIMLNKLLGKPKSVRLSFDMSSMAGPVFRHMMTHNESLFILGAKPNEVEKSVDTIKKYFEGIKIAGFHHGYIKDCKGEIINQILASGAKVVIVGMGAPIQDEMCILLKRAGFVGTVYTCGGFIHQTQDTMIYYPEWMNRLGLRWLYRIFTQTGMLKRLIETYPIFVVTYCWFLLTKVKD